LYTEYSYKGIVKSAKDVNVSDEVKKANVIKGNIIKLFLDFIVIIKLLINNNVFTDLLEMIMPSSATEELTDLSS